MPVVAVRHPAPIFYFGKSVFNFVTLFIECFLVADRFLPHTSARNTGSNSLASQCLTILV